MKAPSTRKWYRRWPFWLSCAVGFVAAAGVALWLFNKEFEWPAVMSTVAFALIALGAFAIAAALIFAFTYHQRLLDSIDRAVNANPGIASNITTVNTDARSGTVANYAERKVSEKDGATPSIDAVVIESPRAVLPGAESTFIATLKGTSTELFTVKWAAPEAKVAEGTGLSFSPVFENIGTYSVTWRVVHDGAETDLNGKLMVTVQAPAAASGITLPFAVANWGGLVLGILGATLVGVLMVTDQLDDAAGAALLGGLLGVGAAAATNGKGNPPQGGITTGGAPVATTPKTS